MIDIIIPAYNCSATLDRALASLEAQTNQSFHVTLVDDRSTEDLAPIIQEHQKKLDLTYIRKEVNEGPGLARQTGIDQSSGDYLAFLDADDVLMPYAVETWQYMSSGNPDIDVFHSQFYEQSYKNGNPALLLHREGFTWMHGKLYKASFLKQHEIRFHPEIRHMEDSYFNSICIELGECGTISIPMYIWINNPLSITRIEGGSFHVDWLSNFIHGIYLSTKFLEGKKVCNIRHLVNTIRYIESNMAEGIILSDQSKKEYEYMQRISGAYMVVPAKTATGTNGLNDNLNGTGIS